MIEPDDKRHGTVNAYTNHACRCQPCRNAWAYYNRTRRWRNGHAPKHGPRPPRTPRHGTRTEYVKHHCRCILCRQAETEYKRNYRRKQAKKASQIK